MSSHCGIAMRMSSHGDHFCCRLPSVKRQERAMSAVRNFADHEGSTNSFKEHDERGKHTWLIAWLQDVFANAIDARETLSEMRLNLEKFYQFNGC